MNMTDQRVSLHVKKIQNKKKESQKEGFAKARRTYHGSSAVYLEMLLSGIGFVISPLLLALQFVSQILRN